MSEKYLSFFLISELFLPVRKQTGALNQKNDLTHPLSQITGYATAPVLFVGAEVVSDVS